MGTDLFAPYIWIVFGLGLLLLTPLKSANWRKWLLVFLNVSFVSMLIYPSWKQTALFVVSMACLYGILQMLQKRKSILVASITGILLFCVWMLYKLPVLSAKFDSMHRLTPLLVAIGFSYFVLRVIELMRAVMDGVCPAPDPAQMINYLVPFNMLAAGPIQSYADFRKQPSVPTALTLEQTLAATERIVHGMFKKYVIALTIERIFLTDLRSRGIYLFFEAQLYLIWLYLDFSAYSDIAVGMGNLLGIATPENFNRPYLARNVIDFWQRWHISLSTFIRRNVFLPVQMALLRRSISKNHLVPASISFFVSFLLCGLWHNVSRQWLLWGVMQALGLIVCNVYRYALQERYGRPWFNRQLANPWIRAVSIALTFEFAALTLAATMLHY